ncbi:MAG TPA: PIG-L family deacetylase [Myxococcota bacterium]|nr:PIG-L family deacetylase [Myxococcota bacterium]HRY96030.1 PIG-L family deacetylase [Myxococcota bacterium]HSA21423.1 PIG-L family deacetylase [Myxococcota bacterium]
MDPRPLRLLPPLLWLGLAAQLAACATLAPVKPDGSPEDVPVDAYLARGARVMWIAPHPDDELFPGPLLARAALVHGNPVYLLVLTHGDGGECGLSRGCEPDLATVRGEELKRAAAFYKAELQHERFWNAPLPVSSFPAREEIWRRWQAQGDPVKVVAEAVRRYRPDLVLTFDPHRGATGHPEHQLAARVATRGLRMAADPGADVPGEPHRVGRVYQLINRYWVFVMFNLADPPPATEEWDTTQDCGGQRCLDVMLRAIQEHRTQHNDMTTVAEHQGAFERLRLRQIDPYTQDLDPAEPAD